MNRWRSKARNVTTYVVALGAMLAAVIGGCALDFAQYDPDGTTPTEGGSSPAGSGGSSSSQSSAQGGAPSGTSAGGTSTTGVAAGGASTTTGVGAGGGGGSLPMCGGLNTLVDSFSVPQIDDEWTTYTHPNGGSVAIQNNALRLSVPPGSGSAGAQIFTTYRYDFRGRTLSFQVKQFPQAAGNNYRDLWIGVDFEGANQGFRWHSDGQSADASVQLAANQQNVLDSGSIADPWRRIRHDIVSDIIYWERSADGNAWTPVASQDVSSLPANMRDLSHMQLRIVLDVNATGSVIDAILDDINVGQTLNEGRCPSERYVDGFDDGFIDGNHRVGGLDATCDLAETGGQLEFTVTSGYCQITSAHLFDLSESNVVIELPQSHDGTSASSMQFRATSIEGGGFQLIHYNDRLFATDLSTATNEAETTYNAANHRFWRIGGSSGMLKWDTSSDGLTWQSFATAPAGFDLERMWIMVQGGSDVTRASPFVARVNGINAP